METHKGSGPTLYDVAEQMEGLDTDQRTAVLLQLSSHTVQQMLDIAKKTLTPKALRKYLAAVQKARGGK